MTISRNGGSGGDGGGRRFSSGLAVGATITFVVTATLAPLVGFFSYPVCYVLDRSDDFIIGNYDKALARVFANKLQEDDAKLHVEARDSIIASRATMINELTERRMICFSSQGPQRLEQQEENECSEAMDKEYQDKILELEKSSEFHSVWRFQENEKLSKIQEEGDFLARRMRLQIEERAKLPEECHQFFNMKTLDVIMKEPVRPSSFSLR